MKLKFLTALLGLMSLTAFAALAPAPLQVCAVPQLYHPLIKAQKSSPVAYEPIFAAPGELYAKISNHEIKCDVLLSFDERMPVQLIRASLVEPVSLQPFTRAVLVLWSPDPALFARGVDPIVNKRLKSLSAPDRALTPAGFAASEVLAAKAFPTDYLKDKIYRGSHEYQVLAMVEGGHVQAGFVTLPLLYDELGNRRPGSYWQVPRGYHSDLLYYASIFADSTLQDQAKEFIGFLKDDAAVQEILSSYGFAPLNVDNEPYRQLLPGYEYKR